MMTTWSMVTFSQHASQLWKKYVDACTIDLNSPEKGQSITLKSLTENENLNPEETIVLDSVRKLLNSFGGLKLLRSWNCQSTESNQHLCKVSNYLAKNAVKLNESKASKLLKPDHEEQYQIPDTAIDNCIFSISKDKSNRLKIEIVQVYIETKDLWKIWVRSCNINPNQPRVRQMIRFQLCWNSNYASLSPLSLVLIDSLMKFFAINNSFNFEIGVHTDCRGNSKSNNFLSSSGAQYIADYFITNGFDEKRITIKGYGESKLLNDCACENDKGKGMDCTDQQLQENRRVEIVITGFNKN